MSESGKRGARDRYFWSDLNKFVRTYMEANGGRRPDRDVLHKEFSFHMHAWFTQKGKPIPNLEDVLKQAKGLRLLEEQRAYMRQYREDKRNDNKDAMPKKRRSPIGDAHSEDDSMSDLRVAAEAEGDAVRSLQVLGNTPVPLNRYSQLQWQLNQPTTTRFNKRPRGAGVQCLMMLVEQVRSGDACSETRGRLGQQLQAAQQQPVCLSLPQPCHPSAYAMLELGGQPAQRVPGGNDSLASWRQLGLAHAQNFVHQHLSMAQVHALLGQQQGVGMGVQQAVDPRLFEQQLQQQQVYLTQGSLVDPWKSMHPAASAAVPMPVKPVAAPLLASTCGQHSSMSASEAETNAARSPGASSCSPAPLSPQEVLALKAEGCPAAAHTRVPPDASPCDETHAASLALVRMSSTGEGESSKGTVAAQDVLQPKSSEAEASSGPQPQLLSPGLPPQAAAAGTLQDASPPPPPQVLHSSSLSAGAQGRPVAVVCVPGTAAQSPCVHAGCGGGSSSDRGTGNHVEGNLPVQLAHAQQQSGHGSCLLGYTSTGPSVLPVVARGSMSGAALQVVHHGGMAYLVPAHHPLMQQPHLASSHALPYALQQVAGGAFGVAPSHPAAAAAAHAAAPLLGHMPPALALPHPAGPAAEQPMLTLLKHNALSHLPCAL